MSLRRPRNGRLEHGLLGHTVGNAFVVYAKERMSEAAYTLATTVAPDYEYDLVVLDLAPGQPISTWESVAKALPKRRRGLRLVLDGRSRETATLAGQWLAERLGCTVVAPDGKVVLGAGGSMIVHSGARSGWVRFTPRRGSEWQSKRFPRPVWDRPELGDTWSTSPPVVAEPLPSGMWLHPAEHDQTIPQHRQRLINGLPCQSDVLTIVLGCPGTDPVPLDDAATLWTRVPEDVRPRVRFVRYGPVDVPAGTEVGQALAERIGEPVTCYPGIPVGSPSTPEIHTVGQDGMLGWQTFAQELRYWPREYPNSPAVPELVTHRLPLAGMTGLDTAVYWYTEDAVVEVVQAGLWIRPPYQADNADAVRAVPWDDAQHQVLFDATNERRAGRMQGLAKDLASRMAPGLRERTRIRPTTCVHGTSARRVAAGPAPAGGHEVASAATSVAADEATASTDPTEISAAESAAAGPAAADRAVAEDVMAEIAVVGPARETGVPAQPPVPAEADGPAPGSAWMTTELVSVPEPSVSEQRQEPRSSASAEPADRADAPASTDPAGGTGPGSGSGASGTATKTGILVPRFQRKPAPEAAAVLSKRGLADERAWLRQTLGRTFDAVQSTVSRILSEQPGMQGDSRQDWSDVVTDAAAVRLYLSEEGSAVDAGLRTALQGPHVPFARCVVSGLNRLPSHRGATVFTTSPDPRLIELYRHRPLVTEWGLLNALTVPDAGQSGTVDVLVWSMTARRATMLEPEDGCRQRVVFIPGTSFKVLDVVEPGAGNRGQIVLRELGAGEIDPDGKVDTNRVSLDELATTALRRAGEKWTEAKLGGDLAGMAEEHGWGRFDSLPGLCLATG